MITTINVFETHKAVSFKHIQLVGNRVTEGLSGTSTLCHWIKIHKVGKWPSQLCVYEYVCVFEYICVYSSLPHCSYNFKAANSTAL